ncbi:hypothetical protein [Nocardioides ochotonae]|uniref:hypothetical protein n=1 Tax=Nocardioides ochotonae TaxID=2685869 RepID=UPI001409D09B|nr:hypothetical protein [Nocardioides ochotonae]
MTAPNPQLPLKDAIHVPEQVHADDFVLQLHRGVDAATRTLQDYVVTPAIASSFDQALGLVQSALIQGSSKGTFIHGSFGSGKSHFMAVMHLLLTGNVEARALPGLQASVAKYAPVLEKNLLAVDYHLLGKKSFEEALYTGYQQTVSRLHPDAPLPVLHKSDGILDDAASLRATMGDEAFFSRLGGAETGAAKWGKRAAGWTAETYDAAAAKPADHPDRERLVRALVAAYYRSSVATREWLEISQGLRAMTQHAKDLGYDGVVLFLDELVLWLGQHLGDMAFIQAETSKVAKLVESEMGVLPVPLISFVARQRELKDFLGGSGVGAEQVALGQSFQWWEDRFDKLTLQATDLPEIVNKRLLQPTSEEGRVSLQAAISRVKGNPVAWRYLLDDEAGSGEVDFTKVYPFSPALVDAMVALSSLMQRERTALKLMSELLAAGRDELTVSDVIPVGDLFDVVVLGDAKPLTDAMKRHFQHAEAFYRRKMRPYLLNKHSVTEEEARALPRTASFRTEDRLAKTLLIAELVPEATSLKNLTAAKLAALNFGTVVSFVPGQEHQQVLAWVREWTSEFGEVTIGAGADPLISIQLSGVDYDSVLEHVRNEDSTANRRKLLRDLLIEELEVTAQGGLMAEFQHHHIWRGSKRTADLVFGNIRDAHSVSDQALTAEGGRWRVVIDYPFDDSPEHGPNDDVVRMSETRDRLESTTVAWIPHYLSTQRMDDLGKLVLLEYLMTGDRFAQNSEHLPTADREPARMQLDNQRKNLRAQLRSALRQAYAVQTGTDDNLGARVDAGDSFVTLVPGFRPRTPQATSLKGGLNEVLAQALDQQYPDHPKFEPSDREVTRTHLSHTLDLVRRAIDGGGRLDGIERAKANTARPIVQALGLGEVRENVLAVKKESFRWWTQFTQWAAGAGGSPDVATLRRHLASYGMTTEVENLLILTWAALDDRQWRRHQAPAVTPDLGNVAADLVLVPAVLPDQDLWAAALGRAEKVFGVPREHVLSAAAVARLGTAVRQKATEWRAAASDLVTELEKHATMLGLDPAAVDGRLATARRGRDLIEALAGRSDTTVVVETLGGFDLPEEPQALAKSLSSAHAVVASLRGAAWDLLSQVDTFDTDGSVAAALQASARAEELHSPLAPALLKARSEIIARLPKRPTPPVPPPTPPTPVPPAPTPPPAAHPDDVTLEITDDVSLDDVATRIRAAYATKQPGKTFRVRWGWE